LGVEVGGPKRKFLLSIFVVLLWVGEGFGRGWEGVGRGSGGGGRGWGGGQEGAWGAFFHTFFSFMWFFSILFFFLLRSSETPTTLPFLDMNLEYPRQAESNCVHRTLNVFYSASKHPEIPMKYAFSKQKTIANISTQFDIGSCCCEY